MMRSLANDLMRRFNAPPPAKPEKKRRGATQLPSGNWNARIYFNGVYHTIGTFKTREEALDAYEQRKKEIASTLQNDPGRKNKPWAHRFD